MKSLKRGEQGAVNYRARRLRGSVINSRPTAQCIYRRRRTTYDAALQRYKIERHFQWKTNMKSYVAYRMAPVLVTLDDTGAIR